MTAKFKTAAGILTLATILLIGACTTAMTKDNGKQPPDWVNGVSSRFPASQYLIGRGAAADLDDAKDRARADLAKVFEVGITAESSDIQTFERVAGGNNGEGASSKGQLQISRNIQTRTDRVIRGVEIADLWQDPRSGTHYALAVLRRLQAAQTLRDDIDRLDEATRLYVAKTNAEKDPLKRIAAASRAVEAQIERASAQRSLQIVDITGRGVPPSWPLAQLRSERETLFQDLTLATRTSGPDGDAIHDILDGAVSAAGFTIMSPGQAKFTLSAAFDLGDLEQREGWYWKKGTLDVSLSDADNKVRGTHRWNIKSSALSKNDAQRRALDQVDKILKGDLRAVLIGFADNK
jgi:LPP20 lipoprotein